MRHGAVAYGHRLHGRHRHLPRLKAEGVDQQKQYNRQQGDNKDKKAFFDHVVKIRAWAKETSGSGRQFRNDPITACEIQ